MTLGKLHEYQAGILNADVSLFQISALVAIAILGLILVESYFRDTT